MLHYVRLSVGTSDFADPRARASQFRLHWRFPSGVGGNDSQSSSNERQHCVRALTANFRLAHKPPAGQVRERWQDLWPFFVSSLHQTGAAIRARISATPAQTRNVGSGIHLPSAPRNPGARASSCLFIAHLCVLLIPLHLCP